MKKILIFTVIFLLATKVLATSTPEIIFNEIMYNPAGSDSNHEWLEIVNVSTSTEYIIDSTWRFNDGSNHLLSVILGDEFISPGEYLVITDSDEIFLQNYPDYQGSLIDTSMSLNNSEDTISLSIDGGQILFATTTYQSSWGANNNGYTLELQNQEWRESYILAGTPGQENSQEPPNSAPSVKIVGSLTGIVDQFLEFTASSTDPDGDELTFWWDLGDGTTSSEQTVSHQYNQAGLFQILLEASDGNLSASDTLEIIIEEEEIEIPVEYSNQIIINEVLPNPSGSDSDDEWIELYNRGSESIDLNNWQLSDATERMYTINNEDFINTVIDAFSYFVVYRRESGIALNNSGDNVELYQPDGNFLDQIEYSESAKDNWAYAKSGGSWRWTKELTPGSKNIIQSDKEEEIQCPSSQVTYVTKEVEKAQESENEFLETEFNSADYPGLKINEFLPNPQGSDSAEWIELYNDSSSTINLFGLSLDDEAGGSKPYQFFASSTIKAFSYLLIPREESRLALNNNSDMVRLIASNNEILREIEYQKAKNDLAYVFDNLNQEWFWSASTTPGYDNAKQMIQVDEIQEGIEVVEKNLAYSIVEIKNLEKGVEVQAVGVVTSLPGMLGKNMFYISEADLSSGIQVYASTVEIPGINYGDIVTVVGKTSQVQGEKRINLLKDSQIEVIDKVNFNQPELTAIDDLNDDLVGNLVHISGELVEKKGSNYYLDDGTGEIRMYIKKSTGIEKPEVEEGYYLDITGILTLTKSGYRLLPRFQEDINVGQILGQVKGVKLSDEVVIAEANDQQKNIIKFSAYGGGSLLAVLLSLFIKLKFLK